MREGNCEEELPEKPLGRQITNRLPTGYQQLTDRLPTVSQRRKFVVKTCSKHDPETWHRKLMKCVADISLEKQNKKTEKKTARLVLTLYRQVTDITNWSADNWPTGSLFLGENLSVVCRPTNGQQSAEKWPTVGRQVFWGALLHNYPHKHKFHLCQLSQITWESPGYRSPNLPDDTNKST